MIKGICLIFLVLLPWLSASCLYRFPEEDQEEEFNSDNLEDENVFRYSPFQAVTYRSAICQHRDRIRAFLYANANFLTAFDASELSYRDQFVEHILVPFHQQWNGSEDDLLIQILQAYRVTELNDQGRLSARVLKFIFLHGNFIKRTSGAALINEALSKSWEIDLKHFWKASTVLFQISRYDLSMKFTCLPGIDYANVRTFRAYRFKIHCQSTVIAAFPSCLLVMGIADRYFALYGYSDSAAFWFACAYLFIGSWLSYYITEAFLF